MHERRERAVGGESGTSGMSRVLVTGGAGFLGSHLCDRLVEAGDLVLCLDNLQTGCRENVAHLLEHPSFTFVEADVTEPLVLPSDGSIEKLGLDEIYNLACPASPPRYQEDPVRTLMTSVLGASHVLDLARRTGARVLQASTSEVYGDPDVHPQTETYVGHVNPIGPRACYDEGKRCAETLFFDMHRRHGVAIRVARIFNTYGPRMDPADGRVVSNFIVQALNGEPLTVYGEGRQTRSFCYVDDLVDGLIRLMNAPEPATGPVNLGNSGEFTILELAERVLAETGSSSRIEHRPLPEDDPRQRRPDISLAKRLLDWEPRVSLAQGLPPTVAYFRSRCVRPAGLTGASSTLR